MHAYKLRKIFETVIYPVEDEIRGIREENEKSWKKVVGQVGSVVFSGIGTTIAFQENFLPTIIKKFFHTSETCLFFLQFFIAIAVFVGCTAILWLCIYLRSKDSDEKRYDRDRKELAEYFHKVILNNILTGISFVKKACNKKKEYDNKDNLIKELDKTQKDWKTMENVYKESQKYYIQEIRLYISEALFYFKIANKQFENKKIFEIGMRREFVEFIDIVGVSTFKNLFDMYIQSYDNLKELNKFINDNDNKTDIESIRKFLDSKIIDLEKLEERYIQKKQIIE